MIVADKRTGHVGQLVCLLKHTGCKDWWADVLSVVIHHHVGRFFYDIREFGWVQGDLLDIWKVLINLCRTLTKVLVLQMFPQIGVLGSKSIERPIKQLLVSLLVAQYLGVSWVINGRHIAHLDIIYGVASMTLIDHTVRITCILIRAVIHIPQWVLQQLLILIKPLKRKGVARCQCALIDRRLQLKLTGDIESSVEASELWR